MLGQIPYTTIPVLEIGPVDLRTFGLLVAVGVLVGATVAARYQEPYGVPAEETYRLATRIVVLAVIGSRLTWVLTNFDDIDSPIDLIAVWEGGLQFSGGFAAGVVVAVPMMRRWDTLRRWRAIDGYGLGLTIGLGIGRGGCYSVGEHFGRETSFFLGTEYRGGETREPIELGTTIHNTAFYEGVVLMVLFAALWAHVRRRGREVVPGTLIGAFCLVYAPVRFGLDFLRVNDRTVLGLTGAQYFMLVVFAAGLWVWFRKRPQLAEQAAAERRLPTA